MMVLLWKSTYWLMSYSLQNMLLGIWAAIPPVQATKSCTKTVRVEGSREEHKVQMIRRIPAKCSSWQRSWAWLTNEDCGTKYRLDYVTLPSQVVMYKTEKVCCPDDEECKRAEASSNGMFDSSDEKFLAITIGSAVLAFLILLVTVSIIIYTVYKRKFRCLPCQKGSSYTSCAPDTERDILGPAQCCNDYVDEERKLGESEYEEIADKSSNDSITKTKLLHKSYKYENVPEPPPAYNTVVPSAPYEEDQLEGQPQTTRKWQSNEDIPTDDQFDTIPKSYSTGGIVDEIESSLDTVCKEEKSDDSKKDIKDEKDKESVKKCKEAQVLNRNEYANFEDLFHSAALSSCPPEKKSPSVHSYEHLDTSTRDRLDSYERLHCVQTVVESERPGQVSIVDVDDGSVDLGTLSNSGAVSKSV